MYLTKLNESQICRYLALKFVIDKYGTAYTREYLIERYAKYMEFGDKLKNEK